LKSFSQIERYNENYYKILAAYKLELKKLINQKKNKNRGFLRKV